MTNKKDYPHHCYHCSFIAYDELQDMKHPVEKHHTYFCPTLTQIREQGLKTQGKSWEI